MSFAEQALQDKIEIRREFQRMYKHSAERAHDIRTRVLPPEKEAVRKKILHRYTLENSKLNLSASGFKLHASVSDCYLVSALCSSCSEYLTAACSLHSRTETVNS